MDTNHTTPRSTDDYSLLFDQMTEGFAIARMIFNEHGRPIDYTILEVNSAYEQHSGLKREQVLGKRAAEFLPIVEQEWLEKCGKVVASGEPARFELFSASLGRWFDVQAVSLLKKNKFGIILSNITDKKKAEALRDRTHDLEEANRQKTDILESISDCFYVLDRDLRFTYVNKAAEEIWGLPRAYLIGRSIEDVFSGVIDISLSNFHKVLEEQITVQYEVYSKVAQRWGTMSVYPTRDGISVYFHDITEHKMAEAALLESRQNALFLVQEQKELKEDLILEVEALNILHRLNSNFIIKGSLEVIYEEILVAIAKLMDSQKASIQLYDCESNKLIMLAGHGLGDDFLEHFRIMDFDTGTFWAAFKEKKRIIFEDIQKISLFKDNTAMQCLIDEGIQCQQSMPLISSSGKILGLLNTYFDKNREFNEMQMRILDMLARLAADTIERTQIEETLKKTSQQAMNLIEELKNADKNRNDFIGILSHELRNPLAAITAGLSLIQMTNDAEKTAKAKEIINRQTGQLCKLVDDLLDLTRINQNKIKLKKSNIILGETLIHAAEDIQSEFDKKGVKLVQMVQPQPLFVYADPVRITQCIGNILFNALKFTQEKGTVYLCLKQEKNSAVITVRDNGIGISPELLTQMFKPFVQADQSLHRQNSNGLGLGLSIVKGITELHGGNVEANSEGIGKGTLITIRLPITAENIKMEDGRYRMDKMNRNRIYKILIVEDNKDLADILCSMLDMMGHVVFAAYDGEEGVAKAKATQPDIIFCDIGLPGKDGYEVARAIREDDRLKSIFLVALTGYAGDGDLEHAKKSGFDRHLSKPVDLAALERVIDEVGIHR